MHRKTKILSTDTTNTAINDEREPLIDINFDEEAPTISLRPEKHSKKLTLNNDKHDIHIGREINNILDKIKNIKTPLYITEDDHHHLGNLSDDLTNWSKKSRQPEYDNSSSVISDWLTKFKRTSNPRRYAPVDASTIPAPQQHLPIIKKPRVKTQPDKYTNIYANLFCDPAQATENTDTSKNIDTSKIPLSLTNALVTDGLEYSDSKPFGFTDNHSDLEYTTNRINKRT